MQNKINIFSLRIKYSRSAENIADSRKLGKCSPSKVSLNYFKTFLGCVSVKKVKKFYDKKSIISCSKNHRYYD